MQKKCGIYCIRNVINDKRYIGQSQDIFTRWRREKRVLSNDTPAWNIHLQNAWKKYGSDKFEFIIIEECEVNELDNREIYWIDYFDSYNNGYNKTIGGSGIKGIIAWNKGLKLSDEYRVKLSIAHKGQKPTESQLKLMSEKLSGENNPHYGKFGFQSSRGSIVYCETLDRFFGSAADAARTLKNEGIAFPDPHYILDCCKGIPKHKTAGKLEDGTRLVWRYATQEEINLLKCSEFKE